MRHFSGYYVAIAFTVFFLAVNWVAFIANWYLRRHGIRRHVSGFPFVPQLILGIAAIRMFFEQAPPFSPWLLVALTCADPLLYATLHSFIVNRIRSDPPDFR